MSTAELPAFESSPFSGLRSRFPRIPRSMLPNGVLVREESRILVSAMDGVASPPADNLPLSTGAPGDSTGLPPDKPCPLLQTLLPCAAATALVVSGKFLIPTATGYWIEAVTDSMHSLQLPNLPRVRTGIEGTAFLVSAQHVVTAAHVVDRRAQGRAAFIFDYRHNVSLREAGDGLPRRYEFPRENVFCVDTENWKSAATQAPVSDDLILFQLDRPSGRTPITIAPLDALEKFQEVALAGYARQQPLTLITAACSGAPTPRVLEFDSRLIRTNVDTFQGNSGSPLLNRNGQALGVHINAHSGDIDASGNALRVDEDIPVAVAIRLRIIADQLQQVGATFAT